MMVQGGEAFTISGSSFMFMCFLSVIRQGCHACRSVFVKILVKFDLEFNLKFEISDGKKLVKFGGRTFLPAREARKFSGRFSGRILEGREPPLTLRQENHYLYFGRFFPCTPGPKNFSL